VKIIKDNKPLLTALGMTRATLHIDMYFIGSNYYSLSKNINLLENDKQKTTMSFKELSNLYTKLDPEVIKYTYTIFVEFKKENIEIIKELLYPAFPNIRKVPSYDNYFDSAIVKTIIKLKKYF
jgi:hypothetical protein